MRLRAALLCSLGLLSIVGCEKRIPKEELGTVVFEVPAVPGAESLLLCPSLKRQRIPQTSRPASTLDGWQPYLSSFWVNMCML